MKKVTSEADPESLNAGDVAQLMGDAAGVAALASVLAPAVGAIAVAAGGLAAAVESRSPKDVVEQMRRNLARIGYMQGVVDESISQKAGQLEDLGAPASAPVPAPALPKKLTSLSAKELAAARTSWAARGDSTVDAMAVLNDELGDLDDTRQSLAHQIDEVGDLLTRLGSGGAAPSGGAPSGGAAGVTMPVELGSILLYGRGWHLASDPSNMGVAFRESRVKVRAAVAAAGLKPVRRPRPKVGAAGSVAFDSWVSENGLANGRMAVLEALAGLERWRGFYDALCSSLHQQLGVLRTQVEEANAARRALAVEVQRRALEGGSK
jgi:hypothetical protein